MGLINTNFNSVDAKYFNENFSVLETNVDNLHDAQVICLVEQHGKLSTDIKNSWLVSKIYRRGDVVLVENLNLGEVPKKGHTYVRYVSPGVVIKGWDSKEIKERIKKLHDKTCEQFVKLETIKILMKRGEKFIDEMVEVLSAMPEGQKKVKAQETFNKIDMKKVSSYEEQKKLFFIFALILHSWTDETTREIDKTGKERNLSYVRAHEGVLGESNKVINIIGRFHLFPENLPEDVQQDYEEAATLAKNYLQTKKYVILRANDSMDSVSEIKKQLKKDAAGGFCLVSIVNNRQMDK